MPTRFRTLLAGFAILSVLAGTPAFAQSGYETVNLSSGSCPGTGCTVKSTTQLAVVGIQIEGTFSGTIQFEQSIDKSHFKTLAMTPNASTSTVTSATGTGYWQATVAQATNIRVRFSSYVSGTAVVTFKYSEVGGGSGGGSSGAVNIADASTPAQTAAVNASGQLSVTCANCSGSGASAVDAAAFTLSTNSIAPSGGYYQTTSTTGALTTGQAGIVQMTANRAFHINLRNAAGTEIGTNTTPLSINIASGNIASGAIASGAVASGAFASGSIGSGAIASGAVASGAYASGSIADGAEVTLGAKADAKSTATDTTPITVVSILKQISASVQAPPSQAVTNAGTFSVQVSNANANGSATSANSSPVVIASDQAAVAIKAASASIASGAIASGAIASGAVASGAYASGSIGSGAIASGAVASGAIASGAFASGSVSAGAFAVGAVPPAAGVLKAGTGTSAMTGTTSTVVIAAQASNYIYVTSCSFSNTHASTTTMMNLQDGSGGTVLWEGIVPFGGGNNVTFPVPLKVPTLGNGLFVVNVTTSSNTFAHCSGFYSTVSY